MTHPMGRPPKGGPESLGRALSELIALRGLARSEASEDLSRTWAAVAGESVAERTRVIGVKRRALHVEVDNSALLGELAGFRKHDLLAELKETNPELGLRDLKFRLRGRG